MQISQFQARRRGNAGVNAPVISDERQWQITSGSGIKHRVISAYVACGILSDSSRATWYHRHQCEVNARSGNEMALKADSGQAGRSAFAAFMPNILAVISLDDASKLSILFAY